MFTIKDGPLRVAIIDDNIRLCHDVAKILEECGLYEVVGTAHNGEEGLRLILDSEARIDVALIDVALPFKDGFYILEEMRKYPEIKPVCIMITAANDDWITTKVMQLGAAYIILKPFDFGLMKQRIKSVWQDKKHSVNDVPVIHTKKTLKPEDYVSGFLKNTPISANLKGHHYLMTAILMAIADMTLLEGVTKVLYPAVAREYHATAAGVERSMRHAIESAWSKENYYYKLLGRGTANDGKPTTRAFITAVANQYYEELNKSKR